MDLIRFFWAILVVYGGVEPVNTQVITSQLYTDLFVTNDYNSNLLPICENGKNVTVRLNIALRQVMAVVSCCSMVKAHYKSRYNCW